MKARFYTYTLKFHHPAGTSRGILLTKKTFFLEIEDEGRRGLGECAFFDGLSPDPISNYESKLQWVCDNIHLGLDALLLHTTDFPSIQIGLEQAFFNLLHGNHLYFPSDFTEKKDFVLINGLIWMGTYDDMLRQAEEKIDSGFSTIKLKIGVDWEMEKKLLQHLRSKFSVEQLCIRVDANGAFSMDSVWEVLEELAHLNIHSIEQPIKKGNWENMNQLCKHSPTPIALDEELIGISNIEQKKELLEFIRPQYCILKPSLLGGFKGSQEWIELCNSLNIGWWITSALESNVGLTAIAQWTYTLKNPLPQGLGTGKLFENNTPPHTQVIGERLWSL